MDPIISAVLQKLKQREHNFIEVTYFESTTAPDQQLFLDNATVRLTNVSIGLIKKLFDLDQSSDWVHWITTGLSYNVAFRLEVTEQVLPFVPLRMIQDWPLLFVVNTKSPVHAVRHNMVTRADIAVLSDESTLVLTEAQRLTMEASDVANQKKVKLLIRTDEECIWQK